MVSCRTKIIVHCYLSFLWPRKKVLNRVRNIHIKFCQIWIIKHYHRIDKRIKQIYPERLSQISRLLEVGMTEMIRFGYF